MERTEYLSLINAPGIGHHGMEWETVGKPAARHKARSLRKLTTALVMTGVKFADLSVNNDRETNPLPWGEWAEFPYIITHRDKEYARLYVVENSIHCAYFVDDVRVTRREYIAYLTPSQQNPERPLGGTITVTLSNLRLIGSNPRLERV